MNFSGNIYKKQDKMEFLISMWIEKDGTIAYFFTSSDLGLTAFFFLILLYM